MPVGSCFANRFSYLPHKNPPGPLTLDSSPMSPWRSAVFVLALAGCGDSPPELARIGQVRQAAVTLAFQDGLSPSMTYAGTRDSSINIGGTTVPVTANHGLDLLLDADGSNIATGTEYLLIRWDLTSIPPGTIIDSA